MHGRILVADDDPDYLEMLIDACRHAGFEVISAVNGRDALDKAYATQFDAIILDIMMPKVDGFAVCRELRMLPATADLPIFILSSLKERDEINKSYQYGANDHKIKPPDAEILKTDYAELFERLWHHIVEYRLRSAFKSTFAIDYMPPHTLNYTAGGSFNDSGSAWNESRQADEWREDKLREDLRLGMNSMAKAMSAHHREWLVALRTGSDAAGEARENRDDWRREGMNVGRRLFQTLFEQHPAMFAAWTNAQPRQGLEDHRLALRLRGPRENLAIPFELMHRGARPLAVRYPISRQVSGVGTKRGKWREFLNECRKQQQPLRALLLPAEDWALAEASAVAAKLSAAMERIDVRVEIEPAGMAGPVTYDQAIELLKQPSFHLVHFVGHGDFDQQHPEQSYLLLRDDTGQPKRLPATLLATLLAEQPVQFLYLSCCAGAEVGAPDALRDNAYLGVLDAAIQEGVPAALGYRWPVVGAWARAFAEHFYDGLFHYPASLEHAAWWARNEIFANSTEGGWGETWFAPILVVQNPDGPAEP